MTFGTGGSTATINTNVSFLGLNFNRDSNFTVAAGAGILTIGAGGVTAVIPGTTSRTYTISEGIILDADQTWTSTNNGSGTTTLAVSGAVSGAGRNLTVTGTGVTNISGAIGTGSGTLTKAGAGMLTLTGANTYSGGTTLLDGTLRVGNNSALGTGELQIAAFPPPRGLRGRSPTTPSSAPTSPSARHRAARASLPSPVPWTLEAPCGRSR